MFNYIADANSNACDVTLMLNLRGRLEPKTIFSEIIYVAISSVCTEISKSNIQIIVKIGGIVRTESGELESVELKLSTEKTVTLGMNQKLNITCLCCDRPIVMGTPQNSEINQDINLYDIWA